MKQQTLYKALLNDHLMEAEIDAYFKAELANFGYVGCKLRRFFDEIEVMIQIVLKHNVRYLTE